MPLPANRKNAKPPKSKTANKQRNSEEHDSSLGLLAPDGYDDNEDLLTMEIPPLPEQMAGCSGPGARLIISHIDVDNFKSYFGRQKIGPFHKNFTAIIGPNGSGKSNVIDSLLFVFGYRASKIRSKKLSALIHSSAGRESIDSCTVAVHFEKIVDISRHEWEVIPESNFYVSRTAYRDGTSKYTLNGRTYQFKDIAKVLRNSGIDLDHSRFLILQGEYADKEKSSMEESVKDVISTLYLENAATIVRNKIFSLKRLMLAEKITSCRADLESIAAEIETSQSRNSELIEQFKQLKKQKKELQNSLDDLNVKLAESKANVSTEEQSSSTSVANLKRLQNKKSKLCDNIESANTQIETLKAVPEKAEKEIEIYTMVINSAESTIKETTEIIDRKLQTVEHRTAELENKKKAVEAELGKHTVTEDEFSSKVVIAQDELNNLQSAEEKAGQLLAELTEKLDVSQEKCSSKKSEFGKTKEKLPSITNEIETINAELVKCRQEESTLSSRFRDLQLELEQARQSAEEFQSSNRLLSAIMQQKEQGSILGIYGRLGDLGAIDEKYNVAISTTYTVNTAQQCIEFLKRKELGRATFVALDKQQHLIHSMRNRPNTPMNAPRLFDLIQVKDEHVLPAFYYALYDTLVADDITKANQIAFPQSGKRWRTVTLKGEVIETSGAMTGGGHGQKKGRIGQSVKVDTSTKSDDLSRRIQQLKNELDKTDAQLTEARRKLAVLEDNKRKKQTEYNALNKLMNNAKLDIENLEKAIALLQEQVFEQTRKKRESAVDPAALDRALQELKRLKKERDKVNDITDDLRMKFVMLKEQSEAISNEIMGEKGEYKEVDEKSKERNAEELAIQKLQKELQERKRALNGRIVELENKVENFSKEEDSSNHTDDQMEVDQSSAECNEPPESLTNPRRKVPLFSEEAIKQFDLETLKNQLVKIEERRNEDDVVNMQLLKDYTERLHRYNQESSMYKSISKQRDLHREMCDRLKNQRLSEFMEGFGKVGHALKEMYQMITLGGDASLDLVDSLNPFSEGISFCVRPPKKSWKQIVNLSGGEKTLASLAFVFGLHQYRPTPVYVMDEIDAALDFRNVSIISSYILERTKNAQFVVISLRNNMFERGDRIIGIYKIFDCTHNAVLDPIAAERERQKNAKALKEYAKQSNQINNKDDAEALENLSLGSANGTPRTSVGSGPAKRRLFGSSNSPARKRMSNEEFPE
ncbi:SMC proteins flexible hinge domain-containing protein [Ditylenchus destructor]|nr:SMC proteins flexible hinge domain-containing protein [Ditylenchus destructor]